MVRSSGSRLVALVVTASVAVAACGGGTAVDDAPSGLPEPAAGPVPEMPVSSEAEAASPLPAIAVRRLNGEGGWVQFKDELPAEQPLLIWFWAPF